MILILFVADTCRECMEFFHVVLDNLNQKNVCFSADMHRIAVKTENAKLVCVAATSTCLGLYQLNPFDYYIFTGSANYEEHGFHKLCVSRLKISAKSVENMDELIKLLIGK